MNFTEKVTMKEYDTSKMTLDEMCKTIAELSGMYNAMLVGPFSEALEKTNNLISERVSQAKRLTEKASAAASVERGPDDDRAKTVKASLAPVVADVAAAYNQLQEAMLSLSAINAALMTESVTLVQDCTRLLMVKP